MSLAVPRTFTVNVDTETRQHTVSAKLYEPGDHAAAAWLILGHGAGAGQDSAFMVAFARELAARRLHVVTFNFPYIEQGRRLPDANAVLEACWRAVVRDVRRMAGRAALCVGGKSMGGRIASQVAAGGDETAEGIRGLVFLGYPLHPPGRPDRPRVAHWPAIRVPALFVQGTRDTFGTPGELRSFLPRFGGRAEIAAIEEGDHSFRIPKRRTASQDAVYSGIQDAVAAWVLAT